MGSMPYLLYTVLLFSTKVQESLATGEGALAAS
jgi:hypothetical protein